MYPMPHDTPEHTWEEIQAIEHKFKRASDYIESLKNAAKKQYAKDYYQFLRDPRPHCKDKPELPLDEVKAPPEYAGLSYMAAQAVRINLNEIMESI